MPNILSWVQLVIEMQDHRIAHYQVTVSRQDQRGGLEIRSLQWTRGKRRENPRVTLEKLLKQMLLCS